jgi:SAM-dependent methyltransferase
MPFRKPVIAEDWYHVSFDSLYPIIYAHRTVEAARAESIFSIEQTKLRKGERVLDLCCGSGRHMAHLLRVTPHVVGLDYSTHLLAMAKEQLKGARGLVRGDMRHQPFDNVFDVVMNYFTSFGYFTTREENVRVVRNIAKSLKPGGRFFIDYLNREWAEDSLLSESIRHVDGYEVRERRWIDIDLHRINKSTRVLRDGEEINQHGESVQLYTPDAFVDILTEGGLRVDEVFGDYNGAALAPERPRMIAVGTRA